MKTGDPCEGGKGLGFVWNAKTDSCVDPAELGEGGAFTEGGRPRQRPPVQPNNQTFRPVDLDGVTSVAWHAEQDAQQDALRNGVMLLGLAGGAAAGGYVRGVLGAVVGGLAGLVGGYLAAQAIDP